MVSQPLNQRLLLLIIFMPLLLRLRCCLLNILLKVSKCILNDVIKHVKSHCRKRVNHETHSVVRFSVFVCKEQCVYDAPFNLDLLAPELHELFPECWRTWKTALLLGLFVADDCKIFNIFLGKILRIQFVELAILY